MPLRLYMDQHVPLSITTGLRLRHIDVLSAFEDAAAQLTDPELLDRAWALGRALFTFDDDLVAEARRRQRAELPFAGVLYTRATRVAIGALLDDLEIVAKVATRRTCGARSSSCRCRQRLQHDRPFVLPAR